MNVPERNRLVKKLLVATYPNVSISVKAGNGTAYRWVYIKFGERVGPPPGTQYNRVEEAIADLIVGAGIEISHFNADDMGGEHMLPCISITMPYRSGA